MFNLEQAVIEWRQQMLAAGIKTPVPLEELEIHLREEIEQQSKTGLDERQAFEIAVQQIGPREVLRSEFSKNSCSSWRSGDDRTTKTNQILGVLWLAQSIGFLIRFATSPAAAAIILYFPHYWQFFTVFFTLLSSTGVVGSLLLFRGAMLGLSIIRIMAVLEFLLCAIEYATDDKSFGDLNYWFGISSVFSFITIWLLRSPSGTSRKIVAK